MSSFLKPLAVLLISILIFAGVSYLADKDLSDYIQTHFYNPSLIKAYIAENKKDAELAEDYIYELQERFAASLRESAVRSSFLYNQNADDIFERSKIYGMLTENTIGLLSVQFVDSNGIRIHFSTSSRDIISQTATQTSYRNYTEDSLALPFEIVSVLENENIKFTMDDKTDRIVFSYPFTDSMNVYHGTALFSVSSGAIADKLVAEGRLKVNENVSVIMIPPGVLFGIPASFKTELGSKISEIWSGEIKERITISSVSSDIKFSLISYKSDSGIFFGRLVNDEIFYISDSMKNILYASMFLTFYLALFFILNFKPSPVTVVRNRIRRLRETLFEQLYEDKSTQEKIRWLLELEQRRDEIKHELKYKLRINGKTNKILDNIIDKSWDEIIAVVQASSGHAALALKLSSLDAKEIVQKAQLVSGASEEFKLIETAEAIEEMEELAEEISETAAEAEQIETIAEEIEEIDEIEEINEETGETEAIDEIESADTLSFVEEIDKETEEAEETVKFAKSTRITNDLTDYIEELGEDQITIEFSHVPSVKTPPKGLLQLASEFEILEEEDIHVSHKGLLRLASEIEESLRPTEVQTSSKGLLRLASEYISEPCYQYSTRGLLARAIEEIRKNNTKAIHSVKTKSNRRGLLALASEIEFSGSVKNEIDDIDDSVEEIINMDIVSPFVSMFSSLDEIKIEE